MATKKLPKFKGRRFTAEPVVIWRVWDALDQEYLSVSWGADDLENEIAEERALAFADDMEKLRPM